MTAEGGPSPGIGASQGIRSLPRSGTRIGPVSIRFGRPTAVSFRASVLRVPESVSGEGAKEVFASVIPRLDVLSVRPHVICINCIKG
jgi:hypothetical protein